MKKIIIASALLGAVALGGCQFDLSAFNAKINDAATKDLPTLCSLGTQADAAFQIANGATPQPAKVVKAEAAAYAALAAVCANPPADVNSGIHTTAMAYAALIKAYKGS